MEAEFDYNNETMSNLKITRWEGDWDQFKWFFKATTCLNGVVEAVQVGDLVAQGHPWPHSGIKEETAENAPLLEQKTENRKAGPSKRGPI